MFHFFSFATLQVRLNRTHRFPALRTVTEGMLVDISIMYDSIRHARHCKGIAAALGVLEKLLGAVRLTLS